VNDRLSEVFELSPAGFNLAVNLSAPRFERVDRVPIASLFHALKHGRRGLYFLWRMRHNTGLSFDWLWPGLAGFGSIWLDLAKFGFGLDFSLGFYTFRARMNPKGELRGCRKRHSSY
jgi:hypothetical protein